MDMAPATGKKAPIFPAAERYPDSIFSHCALSSAFVHRCSDGKHRVDDAIIPCVAAAGGFQRPWVRRRRLDRVMTMPSVQNITARLLAYRRRTYCARV